MAVVGRRWRGAAGEDEHEVALGVEHHPRSARDEQHLLVERQCVERGEGVYADCAGGGGIVDCGFEYLFLACEVAVEGAGTRREASGLLDAHNRCARDSVVGEEP